MSIFAWDDAGCSHGGQTIEGTIREYTNLSIRRTGTLFNCEMVLLNSEMFLDDDIWNVLSIQFAESKFLSLRSLEKR